MCPRAHEGSTGRVCEQHPGALTLMKCSGDLGALSPGHPHCVCQNEPSTCSTGSKHGAQGTPCGLQIARPGSAGTGSHAVTNAQALSESGHPQPQGWHSSMVRRRLGAAGGYPERNELPTWPFTTPKLSLCLGLSCVIHVLGNVDPSFTIRVVETWQ